MSSQSMDRRTVRRIGLALSISLAVHGALLVLIQAQPGAAPSLRGSSTLHARIEVQSVDEKVPGLEHDSLAAEAPSEQSEAAGVTEPKEAASPIRATPDTARSEPVTTAPGAGGAATTPTPETNSLEMPFARDPTYYTVAALDTPPSLLGPADACYPQGAIGEVAYVLLIDEHGAVDQVSVAAVQPSGLFTGAAVELCGQLKFAPGIRNGRPVRSRVRFVVGPTLQ